MNNFVKTVLILGGAYVLGSIIKKIYDLDERVKTLEDLHADDILTEEDEKAEETEEKPEEKKKVISLTREELEKFSKINREDLETFNKIASELSRDIFGEDLFKRE